MIEFDPAHFENKKTNEMNKPRKVCKPNEYSFENRSPIVLCMNTFAYKYIECDYEYVVCDYEYMETDHVQYMNIHGHGRRNKYSARYLVFGWIVSYAIIIIKRIGFLKFVYVISILFKLF